MGRRTWESLPGALDKRLNIVVSRQLNYKAQGALVTDNLEHALAIAQDDTQTDEVMIIGGANLYAQALPLADRIYLTEVQAEVPGDVYFPEWDRAGWQAESIIEQDADDVNEYALRYIDLVKKV